jgi:hypothetical protein
MAANSTTAVFWDVTPCSLVEAYGSFRGEQRTRRPDDGCSKHLRNVGELVPSDDKVQHRRRQ